MALETGTFISDLVATNPTGSDALAFADDHLRLIKTTVKNTFPNISGAVTKTHTEINTAVDQAAAALPKAGGTMTGLLTLSGAPTVDLHAATKSYVDSAVGGISLPYVRYDTASQGLNATQQGNARTNINAQVARTITAGTGVSVTNGDGVAGNPTVTNTGVLTVNGQAGAVSVTEATTSNVLSATAGAAVGAVGTYAFLYPTSGSYAPGDTAAGSSLRYGGAGSFADISTTAPSGTWRAMGVARKFTSGDPESTNNIGTIWLRIS